MASIIVENDERPDVRWNRTMRALKRVEWQLEMKNLPGYGLVPFFKGRHVISRDMQIVEGVYLGAFAREAIVVSERDGILLEHCQELRGRLRKLPGGSSEFAIIKIVHEYVRELLPGGERKTNAIIRSNIPPGDYDRKIDLTVFIRGGAGVCRHRGLLGTYFVEKLINERVLLGTRSIDRNEMDEGGHAWARFVSKKTGQILISDAGLDECGDIFEVEQQWGYLLPGDVRPTPSTNAPRSAEPTSPPLIDNFDRAVAVCALLWTTWHYGLSRLF